MCYQKLIFGSPDIYIYILCLRNEPHSIYWYTDYNISESIERVSLFLYCLYIFMSILLHAYDQGCNLKYRCEYEIV